VKAWYSGILLHGWRLLGVVLVCFWIVFLLAPIVVAVAVSFTATEFPVFPPQGLSLRWYTNALASSWFRESLLTSALVALASTVLAILLGTGGAYVLSRPGVPGRKFLEFVLMGPLIIPSVAIGFALFHLVLQFGLQRLSFLNLVVAHAVITLPFTLRPVLASFIGVNRTIEEAALSLGATPWEAFLHVILPGILPGVVAGAIIAFTFSFNDVTVAVFLVGPNTKTLPVELMSQIEYTPDPTPAAITSIIMAITFVFFFVVERTVGLDVFARSE
jgi:putative spermidine/putrescine transport system permease protein